MTIAIATKTTALTTTAAPVRFVGKKEIEFAIGVIKVRGEEFDQAVQQVQLSVLHHADLHGDKIGRAHV